MQVSLKREKEVYIAKLMTCKSVKKTFVSKRFRRQREFGLKKARLYSQNSDAHRVFGTGDFVRKSKIAQSGRERLGG